RSPPVAGLAQPRRDSDDRPDSVAEGEQLPGIVGLEGDDVHEHVHAAAQCSRKRVRVIAVDDDVSRIEPLRQRAFASAGQDDLPAHCEQPSRRRLADLARAAQQEGRLRHAVTLSMRYLDLSAGRDERPTCALFVAIPPAAAEWLDRASFELKKPKQELVAEAIRALDTAK